MSDTQQKDVVDVVDAARERLAALEQRTPPNKHRSKKSQIQALETQIRELLQAGWSVKEIAQAITEAGIAITPGALKNQLYKIRKEREKEQTDEKKEVASQVKQPKMKTHKSSKAGSANTNKKDDEEDAE